jgi:hypothetical protein
MILIAAPRAPQLIAMTGRATRDEVAHDAFNQDAIAAIEPIAHAQCLSDGEQSVKRDDHAGEDKHCIAQRPRERRSARVRRT